MIEAQQLINDNGISQIALGFFSLLLTAVSGLIAMVYKERQDRRDATKAADQAKAAAQEAARNTRNVSNGFASSVLGKLELLDEKFDQLAESQRKHLEWHLEKEEKK